jgi:hypothetical protein
MIHTKQFSDRQSGNIPDTELQHTIEFSSWREFVEYASDTSSEMPLEDRHSHNISRFERSSPDVPVNHFHGTAVWNDAQCLATTGWPEGAQAMQKMFTTLRLPSNKARTVTRFSPHGPGSLSIGRYIDGHPKPIAIQKETNQLSKSRARSGGIIHLGINISQSGKTTASARFKYGCMILSLIDLLERSGRRVELTLFNAVNGSPGNGKKAYIRQSVKLKTAGERLNLSVLAFAVGNAATQRRLAWSVRETLPSGVRDACNINKAGSYGYPDAGWHVGDLILLPGLGSTDDYTFGSEQSRTRWLQARLREQGIEWDGK